MTENTENDKELPAEQQTSAEQVNGEGSGENRSEAAFVSGRPALQKSPQSSQAIEDFQNGDIVPEDSEAETEILSTSRNNTPAKRKQIKTEADCERPAAEVVDQSGTSMNGERDDEEVPKRGLRKRKKGGRDALLGLEEDSDSSWASEGLRDGAFKKPRLSPKQELKSDDESQSVSPRPSANSHLLRKRRGQQTVQTEGQSPQSGESSLKPSRDRNSPALPHSRPHRGTTHEPSNNARAQSPSRRPHRRTASMQSALPTIETRRSKRTAQHPTDPSNPSSPDEPPVQTPPLPSAVFMAKKGRDHFGDTRLARACSKGDLEAVKAQFETNPAHIDEANNAGNTPLHHASLHGHAAVVEFLLKTGCEIDVVNDQGDSPLHDAVDNSHVDVVRLLLKAGLDPRRPNKVGSTPRDNLEDNEDGKQIASLIAKAIKHAPERKSSAPSSYGMALLGGESRSTPGGTHLSLVEYTVKALQEYASHGNNEGVNALLGAGIRPNHDCVVAAAAAGHDAILSVMLSYYDNTDPDPIAYNDNTPLLKAIGKGHLKVIGVLLNHVNPTRRTVNNRFYHQESLRARGPEWQEEVRMLRDAKRNFEGVRGQVAAAPINPSISVPSHSHESRSTSPEPPRQRRKLVSAKDLRQQSAPVANMSRSTADDDATFKAEEAERQREAAEEEKYRKTAEEEELRKIAEKEELRKIAEKEELRKIAEKEELRKAEEEAERLRVAEEEACRKAAEIEENRKAQEAEDLRKAQEAEKKRLAEELEIQRMRHEYLEQMPVGFKLPLIHGENFPVFATPEMRVWEYSLFQWKDIYVVQRHEVDSDCPPGKEAEFMMLNFHAAIILGHHTFDLVDYPHWERTECIEKHRKIMARHYMNKLIEDYDYQRMPESERKKLGINGGMWGNFTNASLQKFDILPTNMIWWIRFDDFIAETTPKISPRLRGFEIYQQGQYHVDERIPEVPGIMNAIWSKVADMVDVEKKKGIEMRPRYVNRILNECTATMPARRVFKDGAPVALSPVQGTFS